MKQGNLFTSTVMLLLAVGLTVYFGAYIIDGLYNPFDTTVAYTYTLVESVEVEGVVVRDELVLPQQTGIVESSRREGERVGAGQVVALVHRDADAQADQAALDQLEQQIEVLVQVLDADLDVLSAARHDESILQSMISLRDSAAAQSLSALSDQVVSLKSLVLQRDYAYGDGLSQTDLTLRLNELVTEQKALASTTGFATQAVYAPSSGLYSADVDGYESIFTVDGLSTLTVEAMEEAWEQGGDPVDDNLAGKLILGNGWYLALSVPQEALESISLGNSITIGFGGEFAKEIDMTVTRIGEETEGNRLLVLYTDSYMGDTTLLRQTTVELIYQSTTGLRIPKTALRFLVKEVEVEEQGKDEKEYITTQTLGVYIVMAGNAEFQSVTLLAEGSDYYVVESATPGQRPLRAGDEIIAYGTDLYDGKKIY